MPEKTTYQEKNITLVKEFDKYIIEHPEFAEKIPNNALVVMQMEGDEEFNRWARETARRAAEKDTPVVYVTITRVEAGAVADREVKTGTGRVAPSACILNYPFFRFCISF